jgi:hypothetical protein
MLRQARDERSLSWWLFRSTKVWPGKEERGAGLHLCDRPSRESDLQAYIKMSFWLRKACEVRFVGIRRYGGDFAGECSARTLSGLHRISHVPAIPAKGKLLVHRRPDSSSVRRPRITSHALHVFMCLVRRCHFGSALGGGRSEEKARRRSSKRWERGALVNLDVACFFTRRCSRNLGLALSTQRTSPSRSGAPFDFQRPRYVTND